MLSLSCVVQTVFVFSTDNIYFQSMSPNPLVARYNQAVNLRFLVAIRSDGIYNDVSNETLFVFCYDPQRNPCGLLRPSGFETSSQMFIVELGNAGINSEGDYEISTYSNF